MTIVYFDNYKQTGKDMELDASNKEASFEKFYKINNSLRYCNGSYWKFKDHSIQSEYDNWKASLPQNKAFNLYYGNGIVD
jgi:hypothetical protein